MGKTSTGGNRSHKFRTKILTAGNTATGMRIPDELVEALGTGKRPSVRITINGHTYHSTVAVMGGRFMVGVSAEAREGAGVAGGDVVDVDIALDSAPRSVEMPAELKKALKSQPKAAEYFAALSLQPAAHSCGSDRASEDGGDSRAQCRESHRGVAHKEPLEEVPLLSSAEAILKSFQSARTQRRR
jgi:hypothetical protein